MGRQKRHRPRPSEASSGLPLTGNLGDSRRHHPAPLRRRGGSQAIGDVWEWTASPIFPIRASAPRQRHRRIRQVHVNQMVCAAARRSPGRTFARPTSSFHPRRWAFSGCASPRCVIPEGRFAFTIWRRARSFRDAVLGGLSVPRAPPAHFSTTARFGCSRRSARPEYCLTRAGQRSSKPMPAISPADRPALPPH